MTYHLLPWVLLTSMQTLQVNDMELFAYVTRYEKTDHLQNFAKIVFCRHLT